jgi:diguanylate cyclase (GGDEF)-like protein
MPETNHLGPGETEIIIILIKSCIFLVFFQKDDYNAPMFRMVYVTRKTIQAGIAFFLTAALGILSVSCTAASPASSDPDTLLSGKRTSQEHKRVLFISSYSESFTPLQNQKEGIHELFDANNVSVDIEYMDSKRITTAENEKLFFNLLQYKLSVIKRYDAVLTGDDAALHFALKYQNELFSKLPIIFFGVNDIDFARHAAENPFVTGTVQELNLKDTLDIARYFQPGARNVIALYDNTVTGIGDRKQFFALQDSFPEYHFSGINSSEYSYEAFTRKLESITDDSIVIDLDNYTDADGNHIAVEDSVRTIALHTHVPVYRASFGGIGDGFAGGKLFSYETAGKNAASLTIAILNGTDPASLSYITTKDSSYCFDYEVLRKYGIKESQIPKGAVIINKAPGFMHQYAQIIIPFFSILAVMLTALSIAVYDNVRQRRVRKALQEKEAEIVYRTRHDTLTGLPNRQTIMETLESQLQAGKAVTILLMDIDNFKGINDADGHTCGDIILSETARRLSVLSQAETCAVARSGGDEFLIICCDTNPETIAALLEKIKNVFDTPVLFNGKEHYLHTSIGIVSSEPDNPQSNELVGNADLAMFAAKKAGKNTAVYYDTDMKTQFNRKKETEALLSGACRDNGFTVVYQPQVDVVTGETHCYEALVRLKNNEIPPSRFIPVAEETDTIITIGRIVTMQVIRQLAAWRDEGIPLHPVSINFSSKQIRDHDYIPFLKNLLTTYGISPSLIEIEITESILLENNNQAMNLFNDFAAAGIKLALDDFGTGYSSINYLTYIPVSKIKLDKTFTDSYLSPEKGAIIETVITLAHHLGLKITVEGIETKDQCEQLSAFSCDYIQGYYFSPPVPGEEILRRAIV